MTDTDPNRPATIDDYHRIRAQLDAEERAAAATPSASTAATASTPADEHRADPVPYSDHEIALDVLTREAGSREKALETLALDPTVTGRMTSTINARRQELQAAADAEALAIYKASPAGRREEAERGLARAEEEKRLAFAARVLLAEDPRYDDDLIGRLSDEEALQEAGMVETEERKRREEELRLLTDPVAQADAERSRQIEMLTTRWFQMAPYERRAAAEELLGPEDADAFAKKQERRTHAFLPIYE